MKTTFMDKFSRGTQGKMRLFLAGIIILVIACGLIVAGKQYNKGIGWLSDKTGNSINLPKMWESPFRLGLDLSGGTQLMYKADMSNIPTADRSVAAEGARDVIERRVNVFGISEPVVQTSVSGGEYKIIVELAGIKNVDEAIKMIGETPLLEFKEQADASRSLTTDEQTKIDSYNKEAEKKAEDVLGKLLSGGDFAALAKQYTEEEGAKEKSGDLGWIAESDNPEVVSFVKNLKSGEFTKDLIKAADSFQILKLNGLRQKTDAFTKEAENEVRAAHLLICYQGSEGCSSDLSKEDAFKKISELKAKATPINFTQLAKDNSTEPGAKDTGGELGWFKKSDMVSKFAEAAFVQKVGTISDAVETEFGYHLIWKQDQRAITEYNISRIIFGKMTAANLAGGQENWKNTELTGKNLKGASVQFNPNSSYPEVSLSFDNEGAKMFEEITGRNIGKPVAIFLDGYAISTPTVNEKITGGQAVISGKFNVEEAKLLAQRLNAGALPVPIELINQTTVGATLGHDSLMASLKAGLFGFLLVALFMIFYYRFPGVLAVVALLIYSVLVLAIFKVWPVTLTLSGIAGFILSIGMAVDANILIFERLKEELGEGKNLAMAVNNSFMRAWPSIRDSNFTTLITCFILAEFTTGVVKGFAITLGLGVLVSMFTAIVITKTFMQLFVGQWLEKRLWLIRIKNKKVS